jgi:hypothetical protein
VLVGGVDSRRQGVASTCGPMGSLPLTRKLILAPTRFGTSYFIRHPLRSYSIDYFTVCWPTGNNYIPNSEARLSDESRKRSQLLYCPLLQRNLSDCQRQTSQKRTSEASATSHFIDRHYRQSLESIGAKSIMRQQAGLVSRARTSCRNPTDLAGACSGSGLFCRGQEMQTMCEPYVQIGNNGLQK